MKQKKLAILIGWILTGIIHSANAEEAIVELPPMDIIGQMTHASAQETVGSSTFLSEEELFESHVFTVNEALRKAPGVFVRDEEGFGIRPNIGMRGMNPFRSTKVSFLEDGLPLNFAPYGDNDIYYHPPIERYDGIDVIKGAEINQYGPQTIGGAINYHTPNVPREPAGFVSFTGGNRDYLNGHARYGGMVDKVGGLDSLGGTIDYIHKEGLGARDNTFAKLDDVNLKGVLEIDKRNALILRGDFYQEDSQSTFGLTEAEYKNFGRYYNPFKNDTFQTERWATSATHVHNFNDDVTLSTSFYWSQFSRDWWRQMNQQPTDTNCDNAGGVAGYREQRLSGQAIDVDSCNFTRGRLRNYETWGVSPTLHARHKLFGVQSELDAGFRAHFENQYRITTDGKSPMARTGVIGENNNRFADAYSGFIQNKFILGKWTVTPGVRVESVDYERVNNLNGKRGQSDIMEALPSFTMSYAPVKEATLFFGMHRGFSPPRVEDSIYNDGNSVEIEAEKSWNYEVGVRSKPLKGLKTDLTLFHNDFENLTVLGTVGGNDSPVAQGEALFQGIEFMNRLDSAELFNWSHNPYLQVAYTWIPTAEMTSQFRCMPLSDGTMSASCPNGFVYGSKAGNRSPYAPEHLITATVGYSHPIGFDAHLETVFVAEQFGDFMNLESGADHPNGTNSIGARSGQYGKIQDYAVVNFASTYEVYKNLDLFVSVKNIFDNQYVVDRVRGILPGSPRLAQAGFKYDF